MNFELFLFLLLMSFVSFAVAILVWLGVSAVAGRGTTTAKVLQFILIPVIVLGYDFLTIISGSYRYLVGGLPILIIAGIVLYYRFGKNGAYYDAPAPSDFKRKESKKSRRIREKREKKAQEREQAKSKK